MAGIEDQAEEVLSYLGVAGIVIFAVFVAFWVIKILPSIKPKLAADVSISQSAITQAASQVKIANLLEMDLRELRLSRETAQELTRELRGLRLDVEFRTRRARKKHPALALPSILHE